MKAQINTIDNNPFKPTPLSTYKDATFKPLIHNLITHPSATLLHAGSGGMKSLFSMYLTSCIAQGLPLFNEYQVEQKNVFYLDCEMGYASIAQRARMMGLMELDQQVFSYFSTANIEDFSLSDPETQKQLVDSLVANNYEVIVIDNVRTGFRLADENKAESWQPVNDLVIKLRNKGISCFILHHNNKSGNYSGSQASENAVENIISIQPTEKQDLKILSITKERDEYGLRRELMNESILFDADLGVFHCRKIETPTYKELVREVEQRLISGEFKTVRDVGQALIDEGVLPNRNESRVKKEICKVFASYAINAEELSNTETLTQWLKAAPDSVKFTY